MIFWAPLMKSPYCASHTTSRPGSCTLYPYSNPIAASSDNGLFRTSNAAFAQCNAWSGVNVARFLHREKCMPLAECAALHVLPGQPDGDAFFQDGSKRQIFRAAQSSAGSSGSSNTLRRFCMARSILRCREKSDGIRSRDSFKRCSRSNGTDVTTLRADRRWRLRLRLHK